jgi:hypothetical protein
MTVDELKSCLKQTGPDSCVIIQVDHQRAEGYRFAKIIITESASVTVRLFAASKPENEVQLGQLFFFVRRIPSGSIIGVIRSSV